MVFGGYWYTGLWTSQVTNYYLMALPLVVTAIFLGRALNQRLSGRSFLLYVYIGLIAVGVLLLLQSIARR
jgi:hypothetical protein